MNPLILAATLGLATVVAIVVVRGMRRRARPLVERIDAILPQTQCGKCGYPGCKPYAVAIANGDADINQCPPGGAAGIRQLSRLLGRTPKPLSAAHGVEKPRTVALIDENLCIGCTLCIQACPVDAIIGASKQMHTVMPDLCTGCDLCVAPCPVDCIAMVPAAETYKMPSISIQPIFWMRPAGMTPAANAARARHELHLQRLERDKLERTARLAAKATAGAGKTPTADPAADAKRALIAAAMERARAQRAAAEPRNTETLTPEQQEEIARIEARRARLDKNEPAAGAQAKAGDATPSASPPDADRSR